MITAEMIRQAQLEYAAFLGSCRNWGSDGISAITKSFTRYIRQAEERNDEDFGGGRESESFLIGTEMYLKKAEAIGMAMPRDEIREILCRIGELQIKYNDIHKPQSEFEPENYHPSQLERQAEADPVYEYKFDESCFYYSHGEICYIAGFCGDGTGLYDIHGNPLMIGDTVACFDKSGDYLDKMLLLNAAGGFTTSQDWIIANKAVLNTPNHYRHLVKKHGPPNITLLSCMREFQTHARINANKRAPLSYTRTYEPKKRKQHRER